METPILTAGRGNLKSLLLTNYIIKSFLLSPRHSKFNTGTGNGKTPQQDVKNPIMYIFGYKRINNPEQ